MGLFYFKQQILKWKYLIFLVVANIVDAIATDIGLRVGIIGEANPIMSWVYDQGVLYFYVLKVGLVIGIGVIILKINENTKIIDIVLKLASMVYLAVISLHIYWILTLTKMLYM